MTANTKPVHSSFDRGSWAAVLYALFLVAVVIATHIVVWSLPTDGWAARPATSDPLGEPRLQANLAGMPSDLQPGDIVQAIDGRLLGDYARASYAWGGYQQPDWDGAELAYTVRRAGQTLTVQVPVQRLSPAAHILGSLSIAVGVANPVAAALETFTAFAFAGLSLFVFLRRPRERASQALLIMGSAFLFQHYYVIMGALVYAFSLTMLSTTLFNGWIWAILPAFAYLTLSFPEPKWPVRRFPHATPAILFGLGIGAQVLPIVLFPGNLEQVTALQQRTLNVTIVHLLIPLFAIVHSLVTARGIEAHAQIKWVTLGTLSFIAGSFTFVLGGSIGWSLPLSLVQNGGYLALPACLAFAIIRHRLFDIDILIRRALVYTILTATLALVYLGSVLAMQGLFTLLTGQGSAVAIVVSTLVSAALFAPLRRRLQAGVDRRFFRRKYDAGQALAAFAGVTRAETDLDTVVSQLGRLVDDTMQPANLSVWLRGRQP